MPIITYILLNDEVNNFKIEIPWSYVFPLNNELFAVLWRYHLIFMSLN